MPDFDPAAMLAPLREAADALRAATGAPAILVSAARDGRSAAIASGVVDLGTDAPARAADRYEIGSQTKTVTATVVLQLAAEGRLDLDARAADFLPAGTTEGIANADAATVRQLLAMTAGVPDYTEATGPGGLPVFVERLLAGESFGPDDALALARTMGDAAPTPGAFAYSNTGYLLLGRVIETVLGQPLAAAFEDRIFAPLGMRDTTLGASGADGRRLSLYAPDPATGAPIDVTDAPVDFFAEGGVVSTGADMLRFFSALRTPGALLSAGALAEMREGRVIEAGDGFTVSFGLGLVEIAFDDGTRFLGFNGGTLGASSSTYVDAETGLAVAIGASLAEVSTDGTSLALAAFLREAAAWDPEAGNSAGPLRVLSGSAAEARLAESADGLTLALGGARITLETPLRALAVGDLRFADGSALVVGDETDGTRRDDAANDIDILRDFASVRARDNQLIGLGGDDRLSGASGDDRLLGGRGDDVLRGRGGDDALIGGEGDDVLHGGRGDDRLAGGAGRDRLAGGDGADVFVFVAVGESAAGCRRDAILDFAPGRDRIDLSAIDPRSGGADDAFDWIGGAGFSGAGAELRVARTRGGATVRVDLDGDGRADMEIALRGVDARALGADDLIL